MGPTMPGLLAVEILSLENEELRDKLAVYRQKLAAGVEKRTGSSGILEYLPPQDSSVSLSAGRGIFLEVKTVG